MTHDDAVEAAAKALRVVEQVENPAAASKFSWDELGDAGRRWYRRCAVVAIDTYLAEMESAS